MGIKIKRINMDVIQGYGEEMLHLAIVCYEAFSAPKYNWDFDSFLFNWLSQNSFLVYTWIFMFLLANVYDVYLAGLAWFEYSKDNLEDVTRSYASRQRSGGDSFDNFDNDFNDF